MKICITWLTISVCLLTPMLPYSKNTLYRKEIYDTVFSVMIQYIFFFCDTNTFQTISWSHAIKVAQKKFKTNKRIILNLVMLL